MRRACAPVWLVAALATLVFQSTGCAGSGSIQTLAPGTTPELGPDEGLLVVHVDTEIPLAHVDLDDSRVASNLPKGSHLWVIRIPAGEYRWTEIGLVDQVGTKDRLDLSQFERLRQVDDWVWDDEFRIEIRSGVVNYAGELVIRSSSFARSAGWGYRVRNRNHSAKALRRMQKRYGSLVEAFPLHYAGSDGDRFLDYYTTRRDERKREASAGSGR